MPLILIKNTVTYLFLALILLGCKPQKQEADLVIHNAKIYIVDDSFHVAEAMAVYRGKVLETGSAENILEKYSAKQMKDAEGKYIFPGFIDAHCHFYGYGKGLNEVNLVGTKSYSEVLEKTLAFVREHKLSPEIKTTKISNGGWIIGRGWDQNDWEIKDFPDKSRLDSLFPNTPVLLKRIDGHAVLVNQMALTLAGFTSKTRIRGGELEIKNGKLTGILIDNAGDSLEKIIPKPNEELIYRSLLKAQEACLSYGLTTIDDAGLDKNIVDAIDVLHKNGKLKIRVYAMLTPNQQNLDYYLINGVFKTDRLNVRSFKFYGDGALGSRGACLKKEYADKKGWTGFLLNDTAYYQKYAPLIDKAGFQMNTHCIGDSANSFILKIYKRYCKTGDKRWRIEHAQVVDTADLVLFHHNIIPSVQSTHATSDMYWAEERLGKQRVRKAYAYKDLLKAAGVIALGTDFPVEDISPFKTFYAAVYRKDSKGFPEEGYQMENALSRIEAMKGMTIWPAWANFEETEKGSLEKGKWADFIIIDTDLMSCPEKEILNTKVLSTWIAGEEVFKK